MNYRLNIALQRAQSDAGIRNRNGAYICMDYTYTQADKCILVSYTDIQNSRTHILYDSIYIVQIC